MKRLARELPPRIMVSSLDLGLGESLVIKGLPAALASGVPRIVVGSIVCAALSGNSQADVFVTGNVLALQIELDVRLPYAPAMRDLTR